MDIRRGRCHHGPQRKPPDPQLLPRTASTQSSPVSPGEAIISGLLSQQRASSHPCALPLYPVEAIQSAASRTRFVHSTAVAALHRALGEAVISVLRPKQRASSLSVRVAPLSRGSDPVRSFPHQQRPFVHSTAVAALHRAPGEAVISVLRPKQRASSLSVRVALRPQQRPLVQSTAVATLPRCPRRSGHLGASPQATRILSIRARCPSPPATATRPIHGRRHVAPCPRRSGHLGASPQATRILSIRARCPSPLATHIVPSVCVALRP